MALFGSSAEEWQNIGCQLSYWGALQTYWLELPSERSNRYRVCNFLIGSSDLRLVSLISVVRLRLHPPRLETRRLLKGTDAIG